VFGESVRPSIAFSGEVGTGSPQKTRQPREGSRRLAVLAGRLRQALRIWSGQHPDRPARMTRGEPAVLRVIAPLALLILVATVVCTGFGYMLARQADDYHEAERRQSLAAAVEALRAASPDRVRGDAESVQVLERMSGLKGLRFETEPVRGDREVHSLLDHKGRILGWFSWEPERPATAMMMRLLPLAALIALALAGFAALAMWQLGQLLARSEQHVQKLEYLDVLTDLPNHNHFFELFDQALAKRYGTETLAFAALDLDGFDEVNDALGYAGGDEVLAELGKRLRDALPPSAVIARLGSDEFALMITGRNADSAPFILDTVRQALGRPIFSSQVIQIKVSAGLAMAPRDGVTRDELTRRADLALRAAKRRHRGTTVVFAAEMEAELQERRFIKREVASALATHAFDVYYQPIVKADGGAIAGVEALLRWNNPERGAISPSEFVPVAEEAGLMDRLGEFVLRRAVADAARWGDLYVSVNVSPVQVRDRAFVDLVSAVLRESEFEPSRLMLEMTEGVLIDNPEQTTERLLELRALGVRLALDDFGSGYSSLSYLQKLPFDKLKVDRSFVAALDRSANGGVIIQAIVTLGGALGMGVVIEGVETEEQRVLLRLAGCNEMQGFLFARPTPRDEISRLLTQAGSAPAARTHLRAVI
jgi:diguanylate cyclase (GGDEF)-like protein